MRVESVEKVDYRACVGCFACSAVCPEKAITIAESLEGFKYPVVDTAFCKNCGECCSVCPAQTEKVTKSKGQTAQKSEYTGMHFAFMGPDLLRWETADGAVIDCLGIEALVNGGAVLAPVFSDGYCEVGYVLFKDTKDWLGRKRCEYSYIEPDVSNVWDLLMAGISNSSSVIFVGPLCMVAAVNQYLVKHSVNAERLITVAVACRGTISPKAWRSYLEGRLQGSEVMKLQFGAKELGWRESVRIVKGGKERSIYEGVEDDKFLMALRDGLMARHACRNCSYEKSVPVDLLVGNYLGIDKTAGDLRDGKGISYLHVCTDRGASLVEKLVKDNQQSRLRRINNSANYLDISTLRNYKDVSKRNFFLKLLSMHSFDDTIAHLDGKGNETPDSTRFLLDYHAGDMLGWTILNREVWNEKEYQGRKVFFANGTRWNRIFLSLNKALTKGVRYKFDVKFRANTQSRNVRLMLTDINTIKSAMAPSFWVSNVPNNVWVRAEGVYTPTVPDLKFFMLASTDFTGKNSYVEFEWIRIMEAGGK